MIKMLALFIAFAVLLNINTSGYALQKQKPKTEEVQEAFPPPEEEEPSGQVNEEAPGAGPRETKPSVTGPVPIEAKPETRPSAIEPEEPTPVAQSQPPKKKKPEKIPPSLAKISVQFADVSLATFLNALSRQTKVNFILSEGLEQKKITAFLDGVTLEEALQVLLGIKGLAYEKIPGKTDTYLITTRKEGAPRTITRIFELKYVPLQSEKFDSGPGEDTSESGVDLMPVPGETSGGGGGTQQTGQESGAGTITGILKTVISSFGRIAVDSRTNSLIITDLPERFSQIESLLRDLDKKSPQVIIEAQIVEISSDGLQRLGIEFGGPNGELVRFVGPSRYTDYLVRPGDSPGGKGFFRSGNLTDQGITAGALAIPGAVAISAVDPRSGVTFGALSFSEFQVLLRAIVTKTRGRILSRPKIMTINNKAAEIRITANQAIGVQTAVLGGGSGSTSVERQMTGLILRVTPQVNGDGFVTMMVEPKMIRVVSSVIASATTLDPVTRAVKSMVRVKNGDTIVVGGLIDTREEKTVRKLPLLGWIPILGRLFSSETTQKVNSELAIFLTPTIMEN